MKNNKKTQMKIPINSLNNFKIERVAISEFDTQLPFD